VNLTTGIIIICIGTYLNYEKRYELQYLYFA
jgi:hypothetical protein